jgi:hypothetical protein
VLRDRRDRAEEEMAHIEPNLVLLALSDSTANGFDCNPEKCLPLLYCLPHIPKLRLALLEVGGDRFHLIR